jgi:hypothetical protein
MATITHLECTRGDTGFEIRGTLGARDPAELPNVTGCTVKLWLGDVDAG